MQCATTADWIVQQFCFRLGQGAPCVGCGKVGGLYHRAVAGVKRRELTLRVQALSLGVQELTVRVQGLTLGCKAPQLLGSPWILSMIAVVE